MSMNRLLHDETLSAFSAPTKSFLTSLKLSRPTACLPEYSPFKPESAAKASSNEVKHNPQTIASVEENDHLFRTRGDTDPLFNKELEVLKTAILCQNYGVANGRNAGKDYATSSKDECASTAVGPLTPQLTFALKQRNSIPEVPCEQEKRIIGVYTMAERWKKILSYKQKLKLWRARHPISRAFGGRKKIAFVKPRVNGRFTKTSK